MGGYHSIASDGYISGSREFASPCDLRRQNVYQPSRLRRPEVRDVRSRFAVSGNSRRQRTPRCTETKTPPAGGAPVPAIRTSASTSLRWPLTLLWQLVS